MNSRHDKEIVGKPQHILEGGTLVYTGKPAQLAADRDTLHRHLGV